MTCPRCSASPSMRPESIPAVLGLRSGFSEPIDRRVYRHFSGIAALLNAQVDVATANALSPECAYLTTPQVASLLAQRQRFASTDSPLWDGNILEGNVLGFKAVTTNQVPADTMIFGDWSQVIFAEWGALELAINPFDNFLAGITGVRAFHRRCRRPHRRRLSAASTIT